MLRVQELLLMLPSTVGDPITEEPGEEEEVPRPTKPARLVVGADVPLSAAPADFLFDSIHDDDPEDEVDAPLDPHTPGPTPLKLTPSLMNLRSSGPRED